MSLDLREEVARIVALHGLGTTTGEMRRPHPNSKWTVEEWHSHILEVIPHFAADRCRALADAILALPQLSDLTVRCGELEAAGREMDRWSLVILSAVNWSDKPNLEAVGNAVRDLRQALAAKAGGDMASRDLSTTTNAAPSASGLAGPTSSGAE